MLRLHSPDCGYSYPNYCSRMHQKILAFRQKCPREYYSTNLVRALFRDIFPVELSSDELAPCFESQSKVSAWADAEQHVFKIFGKYQAQIAGKSSDIMEAGKNTCGIDFQDLSGLAIRGNQGDNDAVEEIEFSYTVFGAIGTVMPVWYMLGLMGNTRQEAYLEVVSFTYTNEQTGKQYKELLNSFDGATTCFRHSVAGHISGTHGTVGEYIKAPPLW